MRLYLVRHPEPDVATGICYGRTDVTVPKERTARASTLLAPSLPRHLTIYSSPAIRCAALAHSLAQALASGPVRFDSRLLEMDFGAWEMQSWNDIPRNEVDAWAEDMRSYRPGGGERVVDVAGRVQAFYAQLKTEGHDALVVCHAGVIRLLLASMKEIALEEIAEAASGTPHRITYGELVVIDLQ